jgi:hypothetical protein
MTATQKHGDNAGIVVSLLCAVHCAATPLVLSLPTVLGVSWLFSESFEWILVASSSALGCASLMPAYFRLHRRKRCVTLFVSGLASIFAGRLLPVSDTAFVVAGAGLIISAHAANHYFCRRCRNCR